MGGPVVSWQFPHLRSTEDRQFDPLPLPSGVFYTGQAVVAAVKWQLTGFLSKKQTQTRLLINLLNVVLISCAPQIAVVIATIS